MKSLVSSGDSLYIGYKIYLSHSVNERNWAWQISEPYISMNTMFSWEMQHIPLVSGLLHAAALTSEKVKKRYTIAPYIFHLDAPANIFSQYKTKPDVAAFSVMMWNEQLNLHVAREIKKRYPDVVIIFGGAQVHTIPKLISANIPLLTSRFEVRAKTLSAKYLRGSSMDKI